MVGQHGVIVLRDLAQGAEGERQGEFGNRLAPEAFALLVIGGDATLVECRRERIVELGAAIGRTTGQLAQVGKSCQTSGGHPNA